MGAILNNSIIIEIYNDKFWISYDFQNFQSTKSRRPREPPPQSLTKPDVNFSAHPAPIDQPLAARSASEQTNSAPDVQYAPANTLLASGLNAAFCISALPNV